MSTCRWVAECIGWSAILLGAFYLILRIGWLLVVYGIAWR